MGEGEGVGSTPPFPSPPHPKRSSKMLSLRACLRSAPFAYDSGPALLQVTRGRGILCQTGSTRADCFVVVVVVVVKPTEHSRILHVAEENGDCIA